jgi:hypothetical protein
VLNAGEQVLSAVFVPTDGANYNGATAGAPLTVTKAATTITWPSPAGIVYGTALGVAQLNATANVPGTFTYSPAAGTVLGSGAQTLAVTFTPDDAANYSGASATVTVDVAKAATTIAWPSPPSIVYGTALGAAQLNATANVSGTFTYSPAAGTVLGSGSQPLAVTFTPDDAANYSGATATVTVDVAKAATTITWPSPADIVYGTPVGPAQLNATANVPGTFTYSYGSTVFLGAGAHTLSVTFTPADAANYTGASAATTLTVTRAPLTIATNAMAKPYGVPLPPFSASATGLVNGDSLASLTGVLSFVTPATAASPVGTYPVTPQGLSSPNYTITFVPGTLTVVQALTSTALVASPNPSGFNEAVTLTATVSMLPPGGGSPSGVVQFFDGATLLGTVPLTTSGTAALTTNGLAAGSHTLTATYGGDPNFAASSQAGALTVKAASGSSTTTVTSSANPATTGQTVTLTAAIAAPSTPTGSVAFYDGSVLIGTVSVSGTSARLTTAGLADGGHAITAVYLGNASIPPSTSRAFAQYVQPSGAKTRAATIALAATPSPATLGSTVTLTATVTGSQNQRPTGRVLFMLNGAVLGEGTLSAAGTLTAKTTLNFAALAHGSHRVEAVYLGDGSFRAAATVISLAVN